MIDREILERLLKFRRRRSWLADMGLAQDFGANPGAFEMPIFFHSSLLACL
jgi:hypothetical protein